MKAPELFEALGLKEGMADDYINLGNVYQTRGLARAAKRPTGISAFDSGVRLK
jgi:hypothetical protein